MHGSVLSDARGPYDDDGPREACGVFAVHGHTEAAKLCYFGLYALQHRGQESAGIVAVDNAQVSEHRQMGLVSEVFNERLLQDLPGEVALGHVRYSTTGVSLLKNAQPFLVQFGGKLIAVAHNGNLTNARTLRGRLENDGSIFQSTMDTEIFVHLLARHLKNGLEEALLKALPEAQGAYSLGLLYKDTLVGARDPRGFRPLCIGRLNGAYILSSETCALDLVGAEFLREVDPGEIVIIDKNGLRSLKMTPRVASPTFCIFEYIYFARPDSMIFGETVYDMRQRMGARLAQEYPGIEADLVMPFPDSGNYAALGYAKASGIPLEMAMIRNHYIGRTFIQPSQVMRDFSVRVKLNPVKSVIRGKRIVIIEDSIIRGTTSKTRIKTIREAGAKEVHMLVSCPPHRHPCYYGIDFSSKGELVAARHNVEWLRKFLDLDSLGYLSLDGLVASTGFEKPMFCKACFDGKYPVPIEDGLSKFSLEAGGSTDRDRGC